MAQLSDRQLLINMKNRMENESGYNPYSSFGRGTEQLGGVTDWVMALRHPLNTYSDFKKYSDKTTPGYETAQRLKQSPEIDWSKALQFFQD